MQPNYSMHVFAGRITKEKIVRGEAILPLPEEGWLGAQSDEVRMLVQQRQFVRKFVEGRWVIGVVDSNGTFLTWPGGELGTPRFAGEFHLEQGKLPTLTLPNTGRDSF